MPSDIKFFSQRRILTSVISSPFFCVFLPAMIESIINLHILNFLHSIPEFAIVCTSCGYLATPKFGELVRRNREMPDLGYRHPGGDCRSYIFACVIRALLLIVLLWFVALSNYTMSRFMACHSAFAHPVFIIVMMVRCLPNSGIGDSWMI